MSARLSDLPYDPELAPGAHNAVFVCLRIQPSEKVTLITDDACREIAASLAAQLNQCGCTYRSFVLEEITQRPMSDMPQVILDDL